jgi:hypothetical protein
VVWLAGSGLEGRAAELLDEGSAGGKPGVVEFAGVDAAWLVAQNTGVGGHGAFNGFDDVEH